MSKLSEIYCECQSFNLFRPTISCRLSLYFSLFLSFPRLSFISNYKYLSSPNLLPNRKKHKTSCPVFFLHFLDLVVAFEKSLLCFICHAAGAPLLQRTVIEQPNISIRTGRFSSATSPVIEGGNE